MKVLVLNGSPRKERSNTLQLADAFVKGLERCSDCETEVVHVYQKNIRDCLGCFGCWKRTPGKCVIEDDMGAILDSYLAADVIIWSFPLYYYGMPSRIKALMDRLLPTNLPFMAVSEGGARCGHPSRYDMSKKRYALLSTCGFYTREHNYDALEKQFDILYGQRVLKIFCPEGELLGVPQLKARCREYLEAVENAGQEWMLEGQPKEETKHRLAELLYPPKAFVEMADASWGVEQDRRQAAAGEGTEAPTGQSKEASKTEAGMDGGTKSVAKALMRQMAAVCNPAAYDKDLTLEFYFTDLKETYQLAVRDGKCRMRTAEDGFLTYTTRIETPYDLWMDISAGKVNGAQAMMEKKYRTLGDFEVMLSLDSMFGAGGTREKERTQEHKKQPNLSAMIFLWCAIWIFLPINPTLGAAIGILAAVCVPLAGMKWELTPYEAISAVCVGAVGLAALGVIPVPMEESTSLLTCLSYFLFGLMWTLSCLRPVPLSAWYSKSGYGGDAAYENPLFIRTNRILTLCWGVLYLLTPLWTYALMQTACGAYTGLINSVCPAILGIFTAWFQKWYPAKVARG